MISMNRTIACTCCWLARIYWNIGLDRRVYHVCEYDHVNVSEQFEIISALLARWV